MATYLNGLVPTSVLAKVCNFLPLFGAPATGGFAQSIARRQAIALQNAFFLHFGTQLEIMEANRTLARQQELYDDYLHRGGNLAAYPGTSIHGWALAIDFGSGVSVYGSPQKIWMDANAPLYGWYPTGNGFSSREAWHYEYQGSPKLIAPVGIKLLTKISHAAPTPPKSTIYYEGGSDDMLAVITTTKSTTATSEGVPKGAKFIFDYRAKTITHVQGLKEAGTAVEMLTLRRMWDAIESLQPKGDSFGWHGDTVRQYVEGGFTPVGW